MARRSGLGKGLGALIPTVTPEEVEAVGSAQLREIPVGQISPNPHQPRAMFDEEALASLTASIEAAGVLQPVLVRQTGIQSYDLIAGERRWRAAGRAGLTTIPALVRDADASRSLEEALVENLHREDLGALEEASAYQRLMVEFGLTQEQVATRVGKSRSAVANTVRLLQLAPSVKAFMSDGTLAAGHGRALLSCPTTASQEELAKQVAAEHMSVRETEDRVRALTSTQDRTVDPDTPTRPDRAGIPVRPAAVLELEELLADHLDTRVRVSMQPSTRGRILIEFATIEDLERIYRVMIEGREAAGD